MSCWEHVAVVNYSLENIWDRFYPVSDSCPMLESWSHEMGPDHVFRVIQSLYHLLEEVQDHLDLDHHEMRSLTVGQDHL